VQIHQGLVELYSEERSLCAVEDVLFLLILPCRMDDCADWIDNQTAMVSSSNGLSLLMPPAVILLVKPASCNLKHVLISHHGLTFD
jgi:hypothetical protein